MEGFEFFKTEIKITGKHAAMAEAIWKANDTMNTSIKRLIDLYILASIVGFRVNRKADADYAPVEKKTIFLEQVLAAKEDLDFIMQMMFLLDNKDKLGEEEAVKQAFRGPQTKDAYEQWKKMFDDYVRGGVEELYERLVIRKNDSDDEYYDAKAANLMSLVKWFG